MRREAFCGPASPPLNGPCDDMARVERRTGNGVPPECGSRPICYEALLRTVFVTYPNGTKVGSDGSVTVGVGSIQLNTERMNDSSTKLWFGIVEITTTRNV